MHNTPQHYAASLPHRNGERERIYNLGIEDKCPITNIKINKLLSPVLCRFDGYIYERHALIKWFKTKLEEKWKAEQHIHPQRHFSDYAAFLQEQYYASQHNNEIPLVSPVSREEGKMQFDKYQKLLQVLARPPSDSGSDPLSMGTAGGAVALIVLGHTSEYFERMQRVNPDEPSYLPFFCACAAAAAIGIGIGRLVIYLNDKRQAAFNAEFGEHLIALSHRDIRQLQAEAKRREQEKLKQV